MSMGPSSEYFNFPFHAVMRQIGDWRKKSPLEENSSPFHPYHSPVDCINADSKIFQEPSTGILILPPHPGSVAASHK